MSSKTLTRGIALVLTVTALAGCATNQMGANYRPIIDTRGVDFNRFEADLRECQQYANQTAGAGEGADLGPRRWALYKVARATGQDGSAGAR